MTSMVLGSVGAAIGGAAFGQVGATLGYMLGSSALANFDNSLFGQKTKKNTTSYHDLYMQGSSYGRVIPTVFGSNRLAGNVIWRGVVRSENNRVRTGQSSKFDESNKYRYESRSYLSFAISITQGVVDRLVSIWADGILLDISKLRYRFYKGDDEQLPDSLIESFIGTGNVPAFREIAYIVFEDFPISDYGKRIPNFTFEIQKDDHTTHELNLRNNLSEIVMIPGTGEFVYDTEIQSKYIGKMVGQLWVPKGKKLRINNNADPALSDAIVSLNDLQNKLPNIEYVSVVSCWFGNSLDIKDCKIKPAVEYNDGGITEPDSWYVGKYNRNNAHVISKDEKGQPNFGGTPSDASLIKFCKELKTRGYKVLFYPLLMMDMIGKPWRGHINGDAECVEKFFHKNGYNEFILHYANLLRGHVDAFVIGSEFVALNKIRNETFVAVDEFVKLAEKVKNILGTDVQITYAADWSEYHHTDGGWYHLDKLWASRYIDVVGIDCYFPIIPRDDDKLVFDKGEGVDFCYENGIQMPLTPEYAWKNLDWWWENPHVNPDGSKSEWEPRSKKIWFTEFGFPSIDNAGAEPNKFFDPKSIDGGEPVNSLGFTDFAAQATAIEESLKYWKEKEYIEKMFLWCWDARPFPVWPFNNEVWSDGKLWEKGHWLNGKVGSADLDKIILEILQKAGIEPEKISVTRITENMKGLIINKRISYLDIILLLREVYDLDIYISNGVLNVRKNARDEFVRISGDELIEFTDRTYLLKKRPATAKLPRRVEVHHFNQIDGSANVEYAERVTANNDNVLAYEFPMMLYPSEAKYIANKKLWSNWNENLEFEFNLPPKYLFLEPADIILLDGEKMKVTDILINNDFVMRVKAKSLNQVTKMPFENIFSDLLVYDKKFIEKSEYEIEAFQQENKVMIAAACIAGSFKELGVFMEVAGEFEYIGSISRPSIMGKILSVVKNVDNSFYDNNSYSLSIIDGELPQNSGVALLGAEIIEFKNIKYLSEHQYEISNLARSTGEQHEVAEKFILIESDIFTVEIKDENIARFKILELGQDFNMAAEREVIVKKLDNVWVDSLSRNLDSGQLCLKWRNYYMRNANNLDDMPIKFKIDVLYDGSVLLENIECEDSICIKHAEYPAILHVDKLSVSFKLVFMDNSWKIFNKNLS